MKVLWINNIVIPQIAVDIGEKVVPVGGWMVKLAHEISRLDEIELHIMFPYKRTVNGDVSGIGYTSFVEATGDQDDQIKNTIKSFTPDIVHIFGTEYRHSYVVAKICEEIGIIKRVVISIQGLASIYSEHYTAFLPNRVIKGNTLRDLIKGNVEHGKRAFANQGKYEEKALRLVQHVIGRTDWDRATTRFINPNVMYHFNNEMLRESFYKKQWNINNCRRHSIFFSQATSPIKGLHLMLDALVRLKTVYPDVILNIAGKSYTEKRVYQRSYYEKYIIDMIKENKLEKNVIFTGFLNEQEMCQKYLNSHVFVSASSIENSPNSVCEAMILGLPVVTSMVGGVVNLITHKQDGFYYQADAPYMLAYYVHQIFNDDELAIRLSKNARITALKRHEPKSIVNDLVKTYMIISTGGKEA